MPQHVRGDRGDPYAGACGERFQIARKNLARQEALLAGGGEEPRALAVARFLPGHFLGERLAIGPHRPDCRLRERHEPVLVALAADHEEAAVLRQHACRKGDQLADAHAGGVEQFDQRMHAQLRKVVRTS
ncbi:hypothetical protein D9M70_481380 [compost metagenome]